MTTPMLLNDYDPEKDHAGAPTAEEAQKRWWAISVDSEDSEALGSTLFYGRGAGQLPTGSAGFVPPTDEFRRFVDAKERESGLAAEMAKGLDELRRLPPGLMRIVEGRKWSDVVRILVDEVVTYREALAESVAQRRKRPKSHLTGPEKLTPSPIRELAGPDGSGDDVCADADPVGIMRRPR